MRQLELFAVDQLRIREGYRALEALDLDGAEAIFRSIEAYEDVTESAQEAIAACLEWPRFTRDHENLNPVERAEKMWFALAGDGRFMGKARLALRKGLANQLISRLRDEPFEIRDSGFCRGSLLADAGRIWEAEAWYKDALETSPDNAGLHRQLGDLLWNEKRQSEARRLYCRALLISPDSFALDALPDYRFVEILERYGVEMAPVFACALRVSPIPVWHDLPETPPRALIAILDAAEKARRNGNHDEMVEQRHRLMIKDPGVLRAYLQGV